MDVTTHNSFIEDERRITYYLGEKERERETYKSKQKKKMRIIGLHHEEIENGFKQKLMRMRNKMTTNCRRITSKE